MIEIIERITLVIFFVLPLYITNMSLLIYWNIRGGSKKLQKIDPIINGKYFGEHRTFLGLVLIIILISLIVLLQNRGIELATVFSIGFILGNLGSSFIKRRLNMKSGASFPFLDQWDFIIGPQIIYFIVYNQIFPDLLLILIITFAIHLSLNIIAFKLKLKENWW